MEEIIAKQALYLLNSGQCADRDTAVRKAVSNYGYTHILPILLMFDIEMEDYIQNIIDFIEKGNL